MRERLPLRSLFIAVLVVLAGCAGLLPGDDGTDTPAPTPAATTTPDAAADGSNASSRPDPPSDELGWEEGYWHDDPLDLESTDGLNASERAALVARTKARVEEIRRTEFTANLTVDLVTREEWLSSGAAAGTETLPVAPGEDPGATWAAVDLYWEALFVVGEDANATRELSRLIGARTGGQYVPATDRIVLITDGSGVDGGLLAHELAHALQDQAFDLTRGAYRDGRIDERNAARGLIEGEARYVETRYRRQCGNEWTCLPSTDAAAGSDLGAGALALASQAGISPGLGAWALYAYADGAAFVDALHARGGWAAVDAAHDRPPTATEQVVHPGRYPDDRLADLALPDRARGGWESFLPRASVGVDGTESAGELGVFTMLLHQRLAYDTPTVDLQRVSTPDGGPFDALNYTAPASVGWEGDRIRMYRRGTGAATEYGYVWRTRWASEADAREFVAAYEQVLGGHGAERTGEDTWRVPDGPYADAFRVVREGATVTVVNGPTVEDLADLLPGSS